MQQSAPGADKTVALWKAFTRNRNMELRNELLLCYIYLVKSIVYRMMPTYAKHVEFDDLMSCGVLGLMDAIDKFDISKEVKFETYASLRIKGEIIDQIRKQDWAPISLRQKIKRVEEGFSSLESKVGRSVTEQEVAEHLDMPVEEIQKTLDESNTFNLICFDDILVDRLKSEESLKTSEGSPEKTYEDKEMRELLAACIDKLPERERMVISLYYNDELTLKEIGLTLGVSESRVSQIHSKALMTLRTKLKAIVSY